MSELGRAVLTAALARITTGASGALKVGMDALGDIPAGTLRATLGTLKTQLDAKLASSDTKIPTQGENDALAGTNGVPSGSNPYVTDTDPRNANTRTPTDGTITDVKVASGAAIVESKLSLASDAAVGTASRRTLGTGAQQAMAGNDSRVLTAVQKDGSIAMTGALTLSGNPTSALHAAPMQYVDAARSGLDVKASCRVASNSNHTLSGTQTVDGVSAVAGDRVLLRAQTAGAENGIWVVASGAWTRATDADTTAKINPGMFTFVEEGTTWQDTGWVLSTDAPITLGTTALTFTQFSQAGVIQAGTGLTKTANTIAASFGTASGTITQGNDSRLSDSRAPSGTAGGDLTGSYPNPTLGNTAVSPGAFTLASITVDAKGRITAASSGTSGSVPDASASVKGATLLDRDPATSTSPIAVGQNSLTLETFIEGLALEWVSTTQVKVKAGAAWVPGANKIVNFPSDTTLAAGGVDYTLAASKWYYVYLTDTGTISVVRDDGTNPTPSAYKGTAKQQTSNSSRRYLGAFKSSSTSTVLKFHDSGNYRAWLENMTASPFRLLSLGTATSTAAVSCVGAVPVSARRALITCIANAAVITYLGAGDLNGTLTTTNYTQFVPGSTSNQVLVELTSSQGFNYMQSAATASTFLDVQGYIEER